MIKSCPKCGRRGRMYLEVSIEDGEEWVCHNCGYRESVEAGAEALPYVAPRNEGFHNTALQARRKAPKSSKEATKTPRECGAKDGDGQFGGEFDFQQELDALEESMGAYFI